MNLDAKHAVRNYETLPLLVNGTRISKEFQVPFDFFDFRHRHGGRESETVFRNRARCDIPEFC